MLYGGKSQHHCVCRYWSITRAVDYINRRTPRMVNSLICACWMLSGFISIPPLLGWKDDSDMSWFKSMLGQQGNRTHLEFLRDLEGSGWMNVPQMDLRNFTANLERVVYPSCEVSRRQTKFRQSGYIPF